MSPSPFPNLICCNCSLSDSGNLELTSMAYTLCFYRVAMLWQSYHHLLCLRTYQRNPAFQRLKVIPAQLTILTVLYLYL